jgi:hypothetical protein
MFELMKIVGVSAVLSAGVVTVSEIPGQPDRAAVGGKIYTDRVAQGEAVPGAVRVTYANGSLDEDKGLLTALDTKGDLLPRSPQSACVTQAWPSVGPECLEPADGTPVRSTVRMITIEQREGNTSVLVRVPAPELAQR